MAKKPGQRKAVFAWRPIHRIVRHGNFFRRDGYYWLERVVLMWTLNGWVAYADENGG